MRRHLRVDGKALRGAARGGHAPMLLSGLWDDGTTAAQLPVSAKKTNEIPVFRDLLDKIPPGDLKDAVIIADQMHTQRRHAKKIEAAGAFFIFTIGGNQEKLLDAADALPWTGLRGRGLDRRPRPRPHRRPHHQDPPADGADPGEMAAGPAGLPRRAVQLRHGRQTARRGRRPRHHQPPAGPGRRR